METITEDTADRANGAALDRLLRDVLLADAVLSAVESDPAYCA
jgi:hypothetical protein